MTRRRVLTRSRPPPSASASSARSGACEPSGGHAMAPSDTRRRAARAYERGRALAAVRQLAPIALLLVGVPLVSGSGPGWAALGGLLAAAGAVAVWRGGVAGRA